MKRTLLSHAVMAQVALLSSKGYGEDDISLMTSYNAVDEIPEPFRGLYTEQDGKHVLSKVVGLKTQDDINRLQGALDKERNDHKAVKGALAKLGDRSIDDVLTILDKVPAWEALEAQSDPSKIDELVNGKLSQHTAPLQRQVTELTTERDGYKEKFEALQTQVKTDKIRGTLKDAALKAKALPEAADDIANMGLGLFDVDDAGNVVVKADAKGVTPGIMPEVWLNDLKDSKPFYWPASQGAGGQGGQGGGGQNNPWKQETLNLTEQGKLVQTNPALARQLAQAAGVTPTW
ncbi:hypothetical protein [Vibrio phage vB_VpS_CA8]|uniref:Uncharacterized protein n=1 Tax=Vibrio phage PH669 TaxID=2800823 RepID=A0A7T6ZMA1_9CAUD|nr:hypothetical protein [Vibrio phage vB_VpS_CA8]QQK88518.1 hypothetical protein [Vibrio phage PH669]